MVTVADWLLVETLGGDPGVVAVGRRRTAHTSIREYLRRRPYLSAVETAIAETVQSGQSLASITSKNRRVIRTEPIQMSDGRIHGVQVWVGKPDAEPPERPLAGPLKWDLTMGLATHTPQSLINSGRYAEDADVTSAAFSDDVLRREFSPNEARVIALTLPVEPGRTLCGDWDVTDSDGAAIRVGFVARTACEPGDDGRDHLVSRGMNWRGILDGPGLRDEELAQRILDSLATPGVHRALIDLQDWRLMKWIDDPSPLHDWDGTEEPRMHPDDMGTAKRMAAEFESGPTSGVLRLRRVGGGWLPLHITVNRIELQDNVFTGLAALRNPTDDELDAVGISAAGESL